MGTEEIDELGIHTGSNSYATIAVTGRYRITAQAGIVGTGITSFAQQIQVNGSFFPGVPDAQVGVSPTGGTWFPVTSVTGEIPLTAGQTVAVAHKVTGASGIIYTNLASLVIERML
jgi:hypothetical protein